DHRPGAEADAEAEERHVFKPVVREKRGCCVLDVVDVRVRVLELSGRALALPEVPVVERQRRIATLSHGLGVGARRLLLHRGEWTNGYDDAARLDRLRGEEVADQRLAFALEFKTCLDQLLHARIAPPYAQTSS